MLKEKLKEEIVPSGFIQIPIDENLQLHYFNSNVDSPEISAPELLASTIITKSLKLHCFVHGKPVPCSIFKDFAPTGFITNMSSLLNILALQKSMLQESTEAIASRSKLSTSLEIALHYLKQYAEQRQTDNESDDGNSLSQLIRFFIEQLELCQIPKHARRYSANTIKTAFFWQLTSSTLYKKLQSFFVLPSLRRLQTLSVGATVSGGSIDLEYLKCKSNSLTVKEKMVTLMIDEVYIAERVEYSNGSFIGITENGTPAKTVLGFMIQSIYCNYKDVVCLIPISTLDTAALHSWFNKVMVALGTIFHVVAVSTDNHICNR